MNKTITAVCCAVLFLGSAVTAYAAEPLDRDYIEAEIWDEMWHGKGDNGLEYPEASYKHHLLDKWLNDNYGSDDYDWTQIGELKYEYKRYYRRLIDGWDFEDDDSGGWTIKTGDNRYSFLLMNGSWQMIDKNGDTVDSFTPYSTLKDEPDSENKSAINDNGEKSPRVTGEVTDRTETASDGGISAEGNDTPDSSSDATEGVSDRSVSDPLPIVAGGAAVVGAGGAGYYVFKKKRR